MIQERLRSALLLDSQMTPGAKFGSLFQTTVCAIRLARDRHFFQDMRSRDVRDDPMGCAS